MVLLKELFEEAKIKHGFPQTKKRKKKNRKKKKKYQKHKPTGFYRVYREVCPKCSQGFVWVYIDNDVRISKVDFMELKKVVIMEGYKWEVTDINDALNTSRLVGLPVYDLKKI